MDECCGCRTRPGDRRVVDMSDLSDFAFALPMWLVYVLLAVPVLTAGGLLLTWALCRVSAWADREITDALASPPSITDGFTDMGEQADTVVWIFGDERPRLTVIDGGDAA